VLEGYKEVGDDYLPAALPIDAVAVRRPGQALRRWRSDLERAGSGKGDGTGSGDSGWVTRAAELGGGAAPKSAGELPEPGGGAEP
jgi:hypothetical protein